jgi:hypothetical protein
MSLRVFDASGRLVLSSPFGIRASSLRLDLRSIPPGVYLVRLDGTSAQERLLVLE